MSAVNRDQIEHWNGEVGQRWARHCLALDAAFAPLTAALFEAAALQPAGQVLDIGCGAGETALIAARRLGPDGHVAAADVSGPLLAVARERMAQEAPGFPAIDWIEADAQRHDFGANRFEHALSRFGVMFFADTTAAFANIRRSLRPGGRLTFLCWRSLAENPWVSLPRDVVLRLVPDVEPSPPDAPGPFRFADRILLFSHLEAAGFREIACEPLDRILPLGRSNEARSAAAHAAEFVLGLGPVARLVRGQEPVVQDAARAAVVEAFTPLAVNAVNEVIGLGAGCWLVSAVA